MVKGDKQAKKRFNLVSQATVYLAHIRFVRAETNLARLFLRSTVKRFCGEDLDAV